ncbi:MAG TPA: cupin domain-containing protein [Acidimicrobiia bacterium]|nr:cupin domain-containing protein [Acidimicrobiia bacterium]
MPRLVRREDMPHLTSTRDTRDRIDLVTEEMFDTTDLRADRITYHPGDTAAAHRHPGAKHFFFVLEGRGLLHAGDDDIDLAAGDVALVYEDEVHWFENSHDEEFSFIELWVPAPSETIWVSEDQCRWAPVGQRDPVDRPS